MIWKAAVHGSGWYNYKFMITHLYFYGYLINGNLSLAYVYNDDWGDTYSDSSSESYDNNESTGAHLVYINANDQLVGWRTDENKVYFIDKITFMDSKVVTVPFAIGMISPYGDDFDSSIYIMSMEGKVYAISSGGTLNRSYGLSTFSAIAPWVNMYQSRFTVTGKYLIMACLGYTFSRIVFLEGNKYENILTETPYYAVIKDENSEFESLLDTATKPYVDLSVSRPLGVYTELQIEDEEHEFTQSCLYSNFTYLENDFNELTEGKKFPITDIRVYNDFQDTTISGNQRIGAIAGGSLKTIDTKLMGEWADLFVPSETAYKLETSTYSYDPYIFVSTYNNAGSIFYQKNSGGSTFVNQSSGLPGKNINVIRVDDRI